LFSYSFFDRGVASFSLSFRLLSILPPAPTSVSNCFQGGPGTCLPGCISFVAAHSSLGRLLLHRGSLPPRHRHHCLPFVKPLGRSITPRPTFSSAPPTGDEMPFSVKTASISGCVPFFLLPGFGGSDGRLAVSPQRASQVAFPAGG